MRTAFVVFFIKFRSSDTFKIFLREDKRGSIRERAIRHSCAQQEVARETQFSHFLNKFFAIWLITKIEKSEEKPVIFHQLVLFFLALVRFQFNLFLKNTIVQPKKFPQVS